MSALADGFKALGAARLAAMGAVALGMMAMLALLTMRGGSDHMALLYGDVDLRESSQIVDELTKQHIAYQIGGQGSQIMVPSDQVGRARLLLAKQGLPTGGSIGYEIFDRGDGLTTNQFEQTINQTRALEGELSRTIRSLDGVRGARVHLVLPRREPFARDRQDAQASIVLTMQGAAQLDHEGIQAIQNLVAAAVPGLRPKAISIVDSRGNLLARPGDPDSATANAMSTEEIRRSTEQRLSRAVEDMLERSLGPGRVRAEAAVEMDFNHINETKESYDPDGQVVRSQQSVNDNSKSTEATPTTTVQNNLPNANPDTNASGSSEARAQETTNYEITKTVHTLVRDQPEIRRISLAVLVDGVDERGADGVMAWRERTPDELARIATLVRSAIGYDEARKDHVEVVNLRFVAAEAAAAPAGPNLFGITLEKDDLIRLAETLLLGVVALLGLLLVLRPMVQRVLALQPGGMELDADAMGATALLSAPGGPGGTMLQALPGGALPGVPLLEDDSMIDVANIDGQIRASSLRKLVDLVAQHPEETLSVMRGWMSPEEK